MRQREQRDVAALRGVGRREVLEHEVGRAIEVRVDGAERLADVIDRRDAHELDVRVHEQAARHLRAAVAAATDDCCLESLCHRGPWYAMPTPMGKLPATLDSALAAVRARGPEMLALTRSWVEINSYTANVEGVNRVGALLREAFALPSL